MHDPHAASHVPLAAPNLYDTESRIFLLAMQFIDIVTLKMHIKIHDINLSKWLKKKIIKLNLTVNI